MPLDIYILETLLDPLEPQDTIYLSDLAYHFDPIRPFRTRRSLKWNFDHIMSSSTYLKLNGFIECHVTTVISILHKSKSAENDFHLALLVCRSTPVSYNLAGPAQLLMGRKVKLLVQTRIANMHDDDNLIHEEMEKCRYSQKLYHDRHARAQKMSCFDPGQGEGEVKLLQLHLSCVKTHVSSISTCKGRCHTVRLRSNRV